MKTTVSALFNSPKMRKHLTPQPHQYSSKCALKNSTASKYCLMLSQYCLFCNKFNLCIFHIWKTDPDLHKFSHKNSLTKVKNVMPDYGAMYKKIYKTNEEVFST